MRRAYLVEVGAVLELEGPEGAGHGGGLLLVALDVVYEAGGG